MAAKKKAKKKGAPVPPPLAPVEVTVTSAFSVPPEKETLGKSYWKLRLEAQAAYLQNMDGCSIEDVHKDPRFAKQVNITTVKKWAAEDGWVEKRKAAYANLQKRLSEEIGSKLTDRLYFEVQSLYKMLDQAQKKLDDPLLKPKSWESVGNFILKMNERLDQIYRMTAQGLIDDTGKPVPQEEHGQKTVYDAKMLREVALLFTAKRREEMRAKLNPPKEATDAEPATQQEAQELAPVPADLVPEIQPPVAADPGGDPGSPD